MPEQRYVPPEIKAALAKMEAETEAYNSHVSPHYSETNCWILTVQKALQESGLPCDENTAASLVGPLRSNGWKYKVNYIQPKKEG